MQNNIKYDLTIRILHWVLFVLIAGMVIVGNIMHNMETGDLKWLLYAMHKATGVVILTLVLVRLLYRITHHQKAEDGLTDDFLGKVAKLNIILLYATMLIFPISGILGSMLGGYDIDVFGLFTIKHIMADKSYAEFFYEIHAFTAYTFYIIFTLHVIGVIYHHYVKKEPIIKKII